MRGGRLGRLCGVHTVQDWGTSPPPGIMMEETSVQAVTGPDTSTGSNVAVPLVGPPPLPPPPPTSTNGIGFRAPTLDSSGQLPPPPPVAPGSALAPPLSGPPPMFTLPTMTLPSGVAPPLGGLAATATGAAARKKATTRRPMYADVLAGPTPVTAPAAAAESSTGNGHMHESGNDAVAAGLPAMLTRVLAPPDVPMVATVATAAPPAAVDVPPPPIFAPATGVAHSSSDAMTQINTRTSSAHDDSPTDGRVDDYVVVPSLGSDGVWPATPIPAAAIVSPATPTGECLHAHVYNVQA